MSLINDALKRAHESQGDSPPPAPPSFPAAGPSDAGRGWALPTAIVMLLAAASLLIFSALFGHKSLKQVAPSAAAVAAAPSPPPEPAPAQAPSSALAARAVSAASPVPAAAPAPASNVAAVATAAPGTWDTFEYLPRVQGIIFTPPHPVAIVNGKIVNVGDRVGRYQVKRITKFNVTFERPDGSLKQLGIGE